MSGSSVRKYDAYKPSGIGWLGEVPAHWSVDRLKWSVDGCFNGVWGDEPDGVNDLMVVRVADFDRSGRRVSLENPTYRSVPKSARNERVLMAGDLLIEKSGGGENQPVGTVVKFDHDIPAVCSNFVARVPVKKGFDSSFLCYLHSALYNIGVNVLSIKQNTGIQNLDSSAYFDEKVGLPPLAEQQCIARYLDRETGKIDLLISKQERLIELLEEKRKSVIIEAVTKGLNPHAKMKHSGVPWIGRVPEEWKVIPLRFVCRLTTGGKDTADSDPDGEYPFFVRSQTVERIGSYSANCEAVLTAGDGAGVGKVFHYFNGKFDFHQRVYMMYRFSGILGEYFYHYFSALFIYVALDGGAKSTVDSLRRPMLQNFPIVIPPVDEQKLILGELKKRLLKYETLSQKCRIA
jgi:type I restriction enzyme, S subunit